MLSLNPSTSNTAKGKGFSRCPFALSAQFAAISKSADTRSSGTLAGRSDAVEYRGAWLSSWLRLGRLLRMISADKAPQGRFPLAHGRTALIQRSIGAAPPMVERLECFL
jgi:hypothetical protein